MAKLVIAYDDNDELRKQFDSIFYTIRKDFQLMATFSDSTNVLSHLEKYKPEAILMDIQMLQDDDGLVALYQIKKYAPEVRVMMLTMFDNNENVLNAICLGADGYMLKSEFSTGHLPHETLRKSLQVIFNGGAYLTPAVAKKILYLFTDESIADKVKKVKERFQQIFVNLYNPQKSNMEYKLTKTQIIVLQKIVEGKTTEEISNELGVSENTTNSHIKAIYRELEVHSRAKVIRKAIEEKIVEFKL